MDITIKNVPEGAEEQVKQLAMVAIERFVRTRDVKVAEVITTKFESDIDAIRVANTLSKKYEVIKEVKEVVGGRFVKLYDLTYEDKNGKDQLWSFVSRRKLG